MGLHPLYRAGFTVFELRGGDKHAVALGDVTEGWEELRAEAKKRFDAQATDKTGSKLDGLSNLDAIEPTLALPSFGETALAREVQLTTSASWAGTYGRWAAYTRSPRLSHKSLRDTPGRPLSA